MIKNIRIKSYITKDSLMKDHSSLILLISSYYVDAISKAYIIEIRNMFIDYKLLEWILNLKSKFYLITKKKIKLSKI